MINPEDVFLNKIFGIQTYDKQNLIWQSILPAGFSITRRLNPPERDLVE